MSDLRAPERRRPASSEATTQPSMFDLGWSGLKWVIAIGMLAGSLGMWNDSWRHRVYGAYDAFVAGGKFEACAAVGWGPQQ